MHEVDSQEKHIGQFKLRKRTYAAEKKKILLLQLFLLITGVSELWHNLDSGSKWMRRGGYLFFSSVKMTVQTPSEISCCIDDARFISWSIKRVALIRDSD